MVSFHSILMVRFVSLTYGWISPGSPGLDDQHDMTYDPHAFNLIPHMFVISKSRQGLVFFWQPKKIMKIRWPLRVPRFFLKYPANISSNTTLNMWRCISVWAWHFSGQALVSKYNSCNERRVVVTIISALSLNVFCVCYLAHMLPSQRL